MRHQRGCFYCSRFSQPGAYALQWLNFPTPGTPRTREGQAEPGRPDAARPRPLSRTSPVCGGMRSLPWRRRRRRLYGDSIDAAAKVDVPGMEAAANHKYSQYPCGFHPGESPMRPEAVEIMRQRAAQKQPCGGLRRGAGRHPAARSLSEPD